MQNPNHPLAWEASNDGETLDKGWRGMLPCCHDNHRNVQAGSWWFLFGVGEGEKKKCYVRRGTKKTWNGVSEMELHNNPPWPLNYHAVELWRQAVQIHSNTAQFPLITKPTDFCIYIMWFCKNVHTTHVWFQKGCGFAVSACTVWSPPPHLLCNTSNQLKPVLPLHTIRNRGRQLCNKAMS